MSPPKQALDEMRFGREFYLQVDVARRLDVPVGTVGNWVRGYRDPCRDQVRSADPTPLLAQIGHRHTNTPILWSQLAGFAVARPMRPARG